MKKSIYTIFISLSLLFTSCGTGLKIRSENFKAIVPGFNGTYSNITHIDKDSTNITDSSYTILSLFNIFDKTCEEVTLTIAKTNQLKITYEDTSGVIDQYFEGKFSKKGYFEIYLSKDKIEIPPLFPIIYSNVHIHRMRIAQTADNSLVIDSYYDSGGNIFILAGGTFRRSQHYYKKTSTL